MCFWPEIYDLGGGDGGNETSGKTGSWSRVNVCVEAENPKAMKERAKKWSHKKFSFNFQVICFLLTHTQVPWNTAIFINGILLSVAPSKNARRTNSPSRYIVSNLFFLRCPTIALSNDCVCVALVRFGWWWWWWRCYYFVCIRNNAIAILHVITIHF